MKKGMTDQNRQIPSNITTQRLRVSDYNFPAQDSSANFILTTNGLGQLAFTFPVSTSGVMGIEGSGQVGHIARWDGSEAVQTSTLQLSVSGNLIGLGNLVVSGSASLTGLNYPVTAGVSGNFITTNGLGVLSFTTPAGVLAGTGNNNIAARWVGATTLGNAAPITDTLDDSGTLLNFGTFVMQQDFSMTGDLSQGLIQDLKLSTVGTSGISTSASTLLSTGGCFAGGTGRGGSIICSISASIILALTNYSSIIASEVGTIYINNDQVAFLSAIDFSTRGQDKAMILATSTFHNFPQDNPDDGGFACIGCENIEFNSRQIGVIACQNIDPSATFGSNGVPGIESALIASTSIIGLQGNRTAVIASGSGNIRQTLQCAQIGCTMVNMSGTANDRSVYLASNQGDSNRADSVIGADLGTRNWIIDSTTGTYYGQVIAINTAVPDFAEYFENDVSGAALPYGCITSLNGRGRLILADASNVNNVVGVVSSAPGITAGDAALHWRSAFLEDEWGIPQMEQVPDPHWIPDTSHNVVPQYDGSDIIGYDVSEYTIPGSPPLVLQPVLNPEYDPTRPYKARSQRPMEWTCVGLVGQVRTRVDDTVSAGHYVQCSTSGIGTRSLSRTNIQCLKIMQGQAYDTSLGYGLGLCLLKKSLLE